MCSSGRSHEHIGEGPFSLGAAPRARSRLRCWHLSTGALGHADGTGRSVKTCTSDVRPNAESTSPHRRKWRAAGVGRTCTAECTPPERVGRGRPASRCGGPRSVGAGRRSRSSVPDATERVPPTTLRRSGEPPRGTLADTCSKKCMMRVGGIARLPRVQANASPMQTLSGRKIDARRPDLQREAVSLTRLRGRRIGGRVQVARRQRPPHIATASVWRGTC